MSGLQDALKEIPDPRKALGKRHPLLAMLMHAVVAMLGGARSLEAIAQFGRDRGRSFALAVGYTRSKTPCKASFHYLFKAVEVRKFEAAITRWLEQRRGDGWRAASIDGKTLCGATGERLPGVHLLAAYAHEAEAAIAQLRVDAKTNEHKAALELLNIIDVKDTIITGDAAFCQRDLSQTIVEKGGRISGRSRTISRRSKHRSKRCSTRSTSDRSRRGCVESESRSSSRQRRGTKVTAASSIVS
jgi:predicted transposase YbfD/YdcC